MLKVHIQPYANGRYYEALNINILLLLLFSLANTGQFHFSLSIEIRRESSNIKINIQCLNILVGNLPIWFSNNLQGTFKNTPYYNYENKSLFFVVVMHRNLFSYGYFKLTYENLTYLFEGKMFA